MALEEELGVMVSKLTGASDGGDVASSGDGGSLIGIEDIYPLQ